jgi:microsomal dipeptidase-like Zn-dependent dipeptidase
VEQGTVVVDTHTHGPHFLPQPYRAAYRFALRRTMPPIDTFANLRPAGVHVVVATAVGDPIVTRWYRGSAWDAVRSQLDQLVEEMTVAGGRVVIDAAGARDVARDGGGPALLLGVEGLDAVGDRLERLDELQQRGVRLAIPVHMRDNQLGTTALPWQQYAGPVPVRRRTSGLTELGRAAVQQLRRLGIIIDVSHADLATTAEVVDLSGGPVIASHTGARACDDFARYLTDDQARSIAGTGGVIGLWPYLRGRHGIRDQADFQRHARHLAGLAGAEHLSIGTDMNGVPGVMSGYEGERDFPRLVGALSEAGFTPAEVAGIAGENFLRVFEIVARRANA